MTATRQLLRSAAPPALAVRVANASNSSTLCSPLSNTRPTRGVVSLSGPTFRGRLAVPRPRSSLFAQPPLSATAPLVLALSGALPAPVRAFSSAPVAASGADEQVEVSPEVFEQIVRRLLDVVNQILQAEDARGALVFPHIMREPLLRIMDQRVRVALERGLLRDMTHVRAFLFSTLTAEAPALAKTPEQAINILFPFAPKLGDAVELENIRGTAVVTARVYEDHREDMAVPAADRERTLIVTYDCLHPELRNKSLVARYIYDPQFAFATFMEDDEAVAAALAARRALSRAGSPASAVSMTMVDSSRARPRASTNAAAASATAAAGEDLSGLASAGAPLPRILGPASAADVATLRAQAQAAEPAMERAVAAAARDDSSLARSARAEASAELRSYSNSSGGRGVGSHVVSAEEFYSRVFSNTSALSANETAAAAAAEAEAARGNEELVTEHTGRPAHNQPDASPAAEAARRTRAERAEQAARAARGRAGAEAAAAGSAESAAGEEAWAELRALFAGKPNPLTLPADADLLLTYPDANAAALARLAKMWDDMAGQMNDTRDRERQGLQQARAEGAAPAEVLAAAEDDTARSAAAHAALNASKASAAAGYGDAKSAGAGAPGEVRTGARAQRKVLACVAALGQEPLTPALLMAILRYVSVGGADAGSEAAPAARGEGALDDDDLLDMPELPLSVRLSLQDEIAASMGGAPDGAPADEAGAGAGAGAAKPNKESEFEPEVSDSEVADDILALLQETDRANNTRRLHERAVHEAEAHRLQLQAHRQQHKQQPGGSAQSRSQNQSQSQAKQGASAGAAPVRRAGGILAEVLEGAPLHRLEDVEGFPSEIVAETRGGLEADLLAAVGGKGGRGGKGRDGKAARPKLPWMDKKKRHR